MQRKTADQVSASSVDFDRAAATWDEKPARVELANAVVQAIRARVPLSVRMEAMEYGCGTGLLALALAPFLASVTAVDSSPGMLDVLGRKARDAGITNVEARLLDLTQDAILGKRFHLVYSSMTLHHVGPVERLMKAFFDLLHSGGWIALADLDTEDGSFHQGAEGISHFGFDRAALERMLVKVGFVGPHTETAHMIQKEFPDGLRRDYSVFLLTARKPGTSSD